MKILARGVSDCGQATARIGVRRRYGRRAERVAKWIMSIGWRFTLCGVNPSAAGLTEAILPSP